MYESSNDLLTLAGKVVAAYVANNSISAVELPRLIHATYLSLEALRWPIPIAAPPPVLVPAVPINKSVTPDYIICLEDGLKFKSLRRHLMAKFHMSPVEYRRKWGLPDNYPMAAPAHSAHRSVLAKEIGLGQMSGRRAQRRRAKLTLI